MDQRPQFKTGILNLPGKNKETLQNTAIQRHSKQDSSHSGNKMDNRQMISHEIEKLLNSKGNS